MTGWSTGPSETSGTFADGSKVFRYFRPRLIVARSQENILGVK